MTDYDMLLMNPFQRMFHKTVRAIANLPKSIARAFSSLWHGIVAFFCSIGSDIKGLGAAFMHGGIKTKLSFFAMGFGLITNGQIIKGLIYLAIQVFFIFYIIFFGLAYILQLGTLGTNTVHEVFDKEQQIYIYTQGDNSMKILLFGTLSIIMALLFLGLYFSSIRASYDAYKIKKNGGKPYTFLQEVAELRDQKFHKTLLFAPTVMVSIFTIIPIIFMVLIAFTNFDKNHQPPGNLFTWVGLQNLKDLFWGDPMKSRTFMGILGWTFTWAIFATFTNYILGMVLALMINKKGIRLKKMWRTCFVVTIAVPQFVSLLLMSQLLTDQGAINTLLKELGWITESIPFLTNTTLARIMVIIINMWVGIPYTMLITTGILMNIPSDLYESARIDGANAFSIFFKITLPYMLFVTTPYLITTFVGNINNFNVIYLLTKGAPLTTDYYQAGTTDLLITWLYRQTVTEQNYNLAASIGIVTFVLVAVISLIIYNRTSSAKRESDFQ